ncbi:MAG: FAD-binding protein [Cytophagales bacterium]|nr:FAD-binding protein [Cytophagales bacterium]
MKRHQFVLKPELGFDEANLQSWLIRAGHLSKGQYHRITRRSVDARRKQVKVNLEVEISEQPFTVDFVEYRPPQRSVVSEYPIIIVGAGPAGLFAALKAIELGMKPIVLERGKDVQARRRDLAAINKHHVVNSESNYCFGEGGAGTYSDGKLYTRSKKRGSIRRVFEILVAHGATEEILFEAHPHIGTNKLPKIVTALREAILEWGGEVHFDSKVTDFLVENDEIKGVRVNDQYDLTGKGVILATGHSARDIFELLQLKQISIEAKPFALGVRVEHPQPLIDSIQYHCDLRGDYLPAAAYSLVNQTQFKGIERGVFSFCMCPGGFIVPAATAPGEVVVNGMSPSRRDSKYANSGIVAAVELEDVPEFHNHGELAMLKFQQSIEQTAWEFGGKTQTAPAQRLADFVQKSTSTSLNDTSYQPGLQSVDIHEVLPPFIASRLRQGFKAFGKKMHGYLTNEAQIVGVESRSSSPIRIPRDKETLEHPQIKGLFPCGEGAGYAGGIVSAAMDGERCAEALHNLRNSI